MIKRQLTLLLGAALLGGCGGAPALGPAPAQPPSRLPAIARFVIHIPPANAGDLHARYVSGFTRSVAITLAGSSSGTTTVNVSEPTTVTVNVNAFAGSNTFTVNLFSGTDGSGSLLSTGAVTTTLSANTADTINVTPLGVPASITLALSDGTPPIGTVAALPLTVTVRDAGGSIITGTYSTPITLTRSGDTSNRAPLSTTTVPNSSTAVTANYDGTGAQGDLITYSAAAGVVTSNSVTLVPLGALVLSTSTVDIRAIGTGLNVTASQINGTVGSSIGTCTGIASLSQSGAANSRTLSISGVAVGTCTMTVTGSEVANQTINVSVTSTTLTVN